MVEILKYMKKREYIQICIPSKRTFIEQIEIKNLQVQFNRIQS